MKLRKTLQNPVALVAQGFAAGAMLFYGAALFSATTPAESIRPQPQSSPALEKISQA